YLRLLGTAHLRLPPPALGQGEHARDFPAPHVAHRARGLGDHAAAQAQDDAEVGADDAHEAALLLRRAAEPVTAPVVEKRRLSLSLLFLAADLIDKFVFAWITAAARLALRPPSGAGARAAQARNLVLECGQLILDCARPPRNLFLCRIQLALDFRFHVTQLALAHHLELRAKHCLIRVEARAERRHVRLHLGNQLLPLLRNCVAYGTRGPPLELHGLFEQ